MNAEIFVLESIKRKLQKRGVKDFHFEFRHWVLNASQVLEKSFSNKLIFIISADAGIRIKSNNGYKIFDESDDTLLIQEHEHEGKITFENRAVSGRAKVEFIEFITIK